MKRLELFFSAILVPLDFLMVVLAGILAYLLRFSSFIEEIRPIIFNLPFSQYFILVLGIALICLIVFILTGLYVLLPRRPIDEFSKIFIATSAAITAIIIFAFFRRELFESRFIILAIWLFSIILVTVERNLIRLIQRSLYKYGYGVHRLVILGRNTTSEHLIKAIEEDFKLGFRIVGELETVDSSTIEELEKLNQDPGIDEIIQCNPDLPKNQMLDLIDFCDERKIDFKYTPGLLGTQTTNIDVRTLAGIPIVELKRTPLDGWGKIIKRTFDVITALILLILLFPLFIVIGIIIKLDSKGPILVKLDRVGSRGNFKLYKFRSMVVGAHKMKKELLKFSERKGPLFKMKNDPRITRVGKFIRRFSLDEFPQLLNVIKGEMSLVGPRPHEPEEIVLYKKHQRKLLAIEPGITGLAQVSGRAEIDFDEEARLDIYYIENWSLGLDLSILLKTPFVVLFNQAS